MLPAHEEILSIQLVTNNKYARQVRSCAAGLRASLLIYRVHIFHIVHSGLQTVTYSTVLNIQRIYNMQVVEQIALYLLIACIAESNIVNVDRS